MRGLAEHDPSRLRVVRDSFHAAVDAKQALPPVGEGNLAVARIKWVARNAGTTADFVRSVAALPRVIVELGDGQSGQAIAAQVDFHCGGARWWNTLARSAYVVPEDGRPFKGRAAHSRRSAANQARAAGVFVKRLSDVEASTDASVLVFGRCHQADTCGGRTYAAFEAGGVAIAVSHVHVDGAIAELAQAVQAHQVPLTGNARYALFADVVEDLATSGVQLILVLSSWARTTRGQRTFQNVLGFQPCQLTVSS